MNAKNVKMKAEELLKDCRPQMIRICMIIVLLLVVSEIFSKFGIVISLVASIIFFTIQHGYIVSSLKVVKNKGEDLKKDDAFVGLRRFKELFPTYLVMEISKGFIGIAVAIIVFSVCAIVAGVFFDFEMIIKLLSENSAKAIMDCFTYAPSLIVFFTFAVVCEVIAVIIVNAYFFATPYLLEEYDLVKDNAISTSFKMIKGHFLDYIKLVISFIGWILLEEVVRIVLIELLSFVPSANIFAIIVSSTIGIYIYYPKFIVSKALLYEKMKREYRNQLIEEK